MYTPVHIRFGVFSPSLFLCVLYTCFHVHEHVMLCLPLTCVCTGLHVKIGFMGAVLDFEYAPGPFRQEISDIDWVCLTSSETTFPHIRIHDLKQEDSLSFFMSTMASTPAALAVVFVNSENNFRYIHEIIVYSIPGITEKQRKGNSPHPPKICKHRYSRDKKGGHWMPTMYMYIVYTYILYMCIVYTYMYIVYTYMYIVYTCRLAEKLQSEEQSPPVPVLVVTKDTGRELLRLVRENPREVFVKVDQLFLHDIVERGGEGYGRVKGHGECTSVMYKYMYVQYIHVHVCSRICVHVYTIYVHVYALNPSGLPSGQQENHWDRVKAVRPILKPSGPFQSCPACFKTI